ncbi:MAG: family 6 glucosyltransferase [Treponema sp.]|nr:family 6 glucosyltransferase [Treponema sp.]
MSKVAVLYICTGRYSIFWKKFFKACEKKFLLDSEKHYFVFTDDQSILNIKDERIHPYFQEVEEWPFPTLKRFEYFLRAKDELEKFDFLVFMNANLVVKQKIYEKDILPQNDEKLFVTQHPGYFASSSKDFPYDRNPECSAYIPEGEGKYYFAGGFNGGKSSDFIKLMELLSENINNDLSKNIIAQWHDESQINRYMYDYRESFRILSPAYLYPQGWKIPFEKKILILDKNKKGGHNFLRGIK